MTDWSGDAALPGYVTRTIPLSEASTYAGEPEGSLVATVIRRGDGGRRRAVLYIHGWSDYFFQSHVGDAFDALGYDFYAIDLRRYGRSLRTGQLAGYIPDLRDYAVELDAALEIVRDEGHDAIVLAGHSTGGLIASLYANKRPGTFTALFLNAPWIEFQGSQLTRAAAHPLMTAMSAVSPTTALPTGENNFYHRTISADLDGEWRFDTNLKGNHAFRIRVGWLRAIMAGQARIERGLDIDVPVLVIMSDRSKPGIISNTFLEEYAELDLVLDVQRIAERAPDLGKHVTLIRIPGALHDVTLSREPIRRRVFDELGRFLGAYA
ncbi:MAG: alpha/beta hydrolase [Propionibacterium sp.]|nr:alpha/beta hydrolase [Propionibacterium sp.]